MTTALRSIVRSTWLAYNKPKEGRFPCMYLDSKRIVTTAVGYRLSSADEAAQLSWFDKDTGLPASPAAVRLEFAKVAAMTSLAEDGAGEAMKVTRLRLSEATIDRLTFERLDAMIATWSSSSRPSPPGPPTPSACCARSPGRPAAPSSRTRRRRAGRS